MSDPDFDRRLERLFADAPQMSDADSFASGLERRLDRGWAARRLVIGVFGVVGGVIGASQLIVSNLLGRMEAASEGSVRAISTGWRDLIPSLGWLAGAGPEAVWMAAALAAVAGGYAISRMIREI